MRNAGELLGVIERQFARIGANWLIAGPPYIITPPADELLLVLDLLIDGRPCPPGGSLVRRIHWPTTLYPAGSAKRTGGPLEGVSADD